MRRGHLGVPTIAVLGLALLGAACGSGGATADGSDAADRAITGATAGHAAAQAPRSLAATDDDDAEADAGAGADDEAPGLPSLGRIEALLEDFTVCLNGEGADVAVLTFEDMAARLPDLPVDADKAELFGYFYDRDPTDPVVAAAVEACESILDDPAIAIFIPVE